MTSKTIIKYVRISPLKIRPYCLQLKGKNAISAVDTLRYMNTKSANLIYKAINSAISAAEEQKADRDKLVISDLRADKGPVYKRQRICSRGRADMIKRKSTHITIELTEIGLKEKLEKRKTEVKNKKAEVKKKGKNGSKS